MIIYMKNIKILVTSAFLTFNAYAADYNYKVVENDQIGIIMLSLGHKKLWSEKGKVNQFKKASGLRIPKKIVPGLTLKIREEDILFKDNVAITGSNFTFVKKIKTLPEYEQHLAIQKGSTQAEIQIKNEGAEESQLITETYVVEEEKKYALDLFLGFGGFIANNQEEDTTLSTTTFTGLQPMLQAKGIYSHEAIGSLSFDLMTKKIFEDQFSFPINIDYRLQYVPKWNVSENFKLALSLSTIRHSYVGKNSAIESEYELKSNFIGLGFVIPSERFWFEFYIEKGFDGKTETAGISQKADNGFRLDTELVYPMYKGWRMIPGINYYKLKNSDTEYALSVLEGRFVFAHEFNF